jgi:Holliday junction DNA helicase RuvA
VRAVRQADLARLTRIPGVGRKTAERLVVELKDRLPDAGAGSPDASASADGDVRDDVLSALANLGYQRAAAEAAVTKVLRASADRDFEAVLRLVLKALAG